MSKKISELEPVDDLFEGCCFPLVQNEETKKVTYQTLKDKVAQDMQPGIENVVEIKTANKVDKIPGKGLSSNDFTDDDKEKLWNPDTYYANGADYAEVAQWFDNNPNKENRLHRFVTLKTTGRKIAIANSTDQIVGVTTTKAAFVGNAKDYEEEDPTKSIVGIVGVVQVKTNDSTIKANDRVMSDDKGYAVKSSNNCGYRVLEVLKNNLLEIVVSPNTDMIQRIKTDVVKVENQIKGMTIESNIKPNNIDMFDGYDLAERLLTDSSPYDSANRAIGTANENYSYKQISTGRAIKTRIPRNFYITITKKISDRFRVMLYKNEPNFGALPDKIICDDATLTNICFNSEDYNWLIAFYTITNEIPDIKIIVENTLNYNSLLRENNIDIFDKVKCDNLFDKDFILKGFWLGNAGEKYVFKHNENAQAFKSYIFPLIKDETYTIKKELSDKFRVALFANYPLPDDEIQKNFYSCYPQKILVDDEKQTQCEFNAGNYRYCVITYTISNKDINMTITNSSKIKYVLKKQFIKDYLSSDDGGSILKINGGYIIENEANSNNEIWSQYNARLGFGMDTKQAPVPARIKSQLLVDGTIIARNQGNNKFNRWGYHVFEGYGSNNYDRITMLTNKHDNELNKKVAELYYYVGASHYASAYAWFKLGSDVQKHSFMCDRDTFVAYGTMDFKNVMTLARISPSNDLITTYNTVEEADAHYEPESQAENHAKSLLYISLKNAENGAMFYDTDRNKIVVKVNGVWCDMNVTPTEGIYNF